MELKEEKVYEAIYWAIKDTLDSLLEDLARSKRVSKGEVFLAVIYQGVKEGVYKALKEYLAERAAAEDILALKFFKTSGREGTK